MALGAAGGGAGRQSGEPAAGTVWEVALERHHLVGIPFWARGKKDSNRRWWPVAVQADGKWTLCGKRWGGGCEGWSSR
jgi:hypothetical protein